MRDGRALASAQIIHAGSKKKLLLVLPDTPFVSQLSHVISQAAAPAFLLGALAAFIAVLISRLGARVTRRAGLAPIIRREPTLSFNDASNIRGQSAPTDGALDQIRQLTSLLTELEACQQTDVTWCAANALLRSATCPA
jgi:hypothetical protein